MTTQAWLMAGLLVMMFALLVWDRFPTWLVFIGTLTVAMTLRLTTIDELLRGFSNPGVITVAALFPIAAGMYSTGAITIVFDWLVGLPDKLRQAQSKILPPVAGASAFLNNTPLVAMLVPVIKDLSQRTGLSASKLFIPLSFSSILGGASTLIGTSTNLIIAGLIISSGMAELNIFAPSLVGIPSAIIGIAFIMTMGTRLLPSGKRELDDFSNRRYKAEFLIMDNSYLIGKTISDTGLAQSQGYQLVKLVAGSGGTKQLEIESQEPSKIGLFHRLSLIWGMKAQVKSEKNINKEQQIDLNHILQPGDVLTYISDSQALPGLWTTIGIKPAIGMPLETKRFTHHLVEVVIGGGHPAIGRYVSEVPVREDPPYSAEIVALSRDNNPPEVDLMEFRIQPGDVGVLEVEDNFFYETRDQVEYSLTRKLDGYRIKRTSRAAIAAIITVTMILSAGFRVMSMLNVALLGGLAMILTGSMTARTAWRSIEWDTVVILGAAVGLSAAVKDTGLSTVIADIFTLIGGRNPYIALVIVFIGCILMTNIILMQPRLRSCSRSLYRYRLA